MHINDITRVNALPSMAKMKIKIIYKNSTKATRFMYIIVLVFVLALS